MKFSAVEIQMVATFTTSHDSVTVHITQGKSGEKFVKIPSLLLKLRPVTRVKFRSGRSIFSAEKLYYDPGFLCRQCLL